jgi:hypothetical protein
VLDGRPAGDEELHAELVRENVRQSGLAEPGRPAQKDVVKRLAALARRFHVDAEVVLVLRLADEVIERLRPEQPIQPIVVDRPGGADHARARFGRGLGRSFLPRGHKGPGL